MKKKYLKKCKIKQNNALINAPINVQKIIENNFNILPHKLMLIYFLNIKLNFKSKYELGSNAIGFSFYSLIFISEQAIVFSFKKKIINFKLNLKNLNF